MPYIATKISTLLLVISSTAVFAADQTVWDECTHTRDSDASIAAYKTKGDNDQSVADYTKALATESATVVCESEL
jgi:hypothetical protein